MLSHCKKYIRLSSFGVKEDFSGLGATLLTLLLFPFICFVMAITWQRINPNPDKMPLTQVFTYVSMTEMLFMSMLRGTVFQKAQGDFSRSLSLPVNWLLLNGSQFYGRSLARRALFLVIFVIAYAALSQGAVGYALVTIARMIPLVFLLSFFDVFYTLALCLLYLIWEKTHYVRFLLGKLFLVLGAVFVPVSEAREPWKQILLASPMSDLFFQPAHFAMNGHFYQQSVGLWISRITLHFVLLFALVLWMFGWAKRKHQSFGG